MTSILLRKKVMVVDDESPIREVLTRYFRRRGFSVMQASSGKEAIEIFTQYRPHIVLLDILMPGLNGLETLKQLKDIYPLFKAIMISAVKDEEVFSKCRELGAIDYIVKPFDLSYLDARIAGKLLG